PRQRERQARISPGATPLARPESQARLTPDPAAVKQKPARKPPRVWRRFRRMSLRGPTATHPSDGGGDLRATATPLGRRPRRPPRARTPRPHRRPAHERRPPADPVAGPARLRRPGGVDAARIVLANVVQRIDEAKKGSAVKLP